MRTLETQYPNFFILFQASCYTSSFIIIYINLALIFWGLLVFNAKCFNKLFTCRVRKWITFHVHSNIFVKSPIIDEAITQSHARIKATCSVWISKYACKKSPYTYLCKSISENSTEPLITLLTDYYFITVNINVYNAIQKRFFFPEFSIPPALFSNYIISVTSFPKREGWRPNL